MPATATLRADAARNRALVLDAAERLFASRGLEVSMQDIADEAGVGVGTVFRRFPTKDDLVASILAERMRDLVSLGRTAIEQSDEDPWGAFAAWFTGATELHVRHRGLMEAVASSVSAETTCNHVRLELVTQVRELVRRAQDAGELRPDVVAEDLPGLQCAISSTSRMPLGEHEPEAWRRACTLFLDGMHAGAARTQLEPAMPSFETVVASITAR